jgi:phage terminase Nu1 subunit (DNA packaging protein)
MTTKTLAERQAELPPGLQPLLTQAQLEDYYGVSDWTVKQWVNRGCPVEPTPFRGRRFDLEHVKAWIKTEAEKQSAA